MVYVIVLVILFAVLFVITAPLRRRPVDPLADHETDGTQISAEMLDLEAERDAKYREIRDAELDHQTGKLSDEDFGAVDSTLRAEAIEILRRLDAAQGPEE